MTDKVQKIREEVRKIARSINPYIPDDEGKNSEYEAGRFAMVTQIMQIIDSLQEEPVSDVLDEAAKIYARGEYDRKNPSSLPWQCKGCYSPLIYAFKDGAKWQKAKDESITEDLGEYINELFKQFPEVSFAKLSRIAVRVAKWQKEQIMKDAVEGEIVKDIANNLYIGKVKVNKNNFKFGDKVKLLVLKEE